MSKLKHKPKKLNHRKNRESALAKLAAAADKYGLNERRRRFVEEYFRSGDMLASAIAVGYAKSGAHTRANEIMHLEGAQTYLRDLRIREMDTAGITHEDWLRELKEIGFSSILDFLSFGPDGMELKDSKTLTPAQARVIAEVKETVTATGSSTVMFKLHDKLAALQVIGKRFGWLKETPCDPKNARPLVIINKFEIVENSAAPTPKPVIEIGS